MVPLADQPDFRRDDWAHAGGHTLLNRLSDISIGNGHCSIDIVSEFHPQWVCKRETSTPTSASANNTNVEICAEVGKCRDRFDEVHNERSRRRRWKMDRAPNYEDCTSFNLSMNARTLHPPRAENQSCSGGHVLKCLGGWTIKLLEC